MLEISRLASFNNNSKSKSLHMSLTNMYLSAISKKAEIVLLLNN